jgi:hypothetical protein
MLNKYPMGYYKLLGRIVMKKKVLFAILILAFLLFLIFFNKRVAYEMSMCAYCGAGRVVEHRIIGTTLKEEPPWFPSENAPEHKHLYFMCASHRSGWYFDYSSDALDIMFQLKKLNDKNQLSDDMIKEWFSIDIGTPEVLKNFTQKHNLEIKEENAIK